MKFAYVPALKAVAFSLLVSSPLGTAAVAGPVVTPLVSTGWASPSSQRRDPAVAPDRFHPI